MLDVAVRFPNLTDLTARDDNVILDGEDCHTMGTIRERPKADGSISYTAQIIMKRKGHKPHREAKTFPRRSAASAWLKLREAELKEHGIERAKVRGMTLGKAIEHYIANSNKDMGRTKAQVLRSIKSYDIGDLPVEDVGSQAIVAFATELSKSVQPQTVQNYLSHLSAVFAAAKPAWGIELSREAMKDAFTVAKRLGLTSKSEKRDRRPTVGEMDKLMAYFTERNERSPEAAPMPRIMGFALFSTRRLGEIVRIEWRDFEREHSRILVRDMKHPGAKIGNDIWCDLPAEAIGFMGAEGTGRIFPYTETAISAAFTRACQFLKIEDLHFHDLRHEGVSRLFEMGKTIPQAASVSGHRGWASLQRYSHLRQAGDKWKDWKWLPKLTP